MNPVASITRAATRRKDEPLRILTCATHESNQVCMARTGHEFHFLHGPHIKTWNSTFRPLPKNCHLLGERLPPHIDFDLAISQNRFGQFQVLSPVAQRLGIPLISLEHTLPMPGWSPGRVQIMRDMRGDKNIFITEYSRKGWGWREDEAEVIVHGIETDLFCPSDEVRAPFILSVVNDWRNRDIFCGYYLWEQATKGLPVRVIGDNPGLSKPATNVSELVRAYQTSAIFLNTSLVSPIPTSLLEAMSSGCACVSTNNCAIPDAIEHGVNGLLGNTPEELRAHCERLLKDKELRERLGAAARQTILRKFPLSAFVDNWNRVFRELAP